jgi:hypothetical protein
MHSRIDAALKAGKTDQRTADKYTHYKNLDNQCANGVRKMTWLDMVGIFRTLVF